MSVSSEKVLWSGGPVYGQERAQEDMEIARSRQLHVAFVSERSGVGKTELMTRYCNSLVCTKAAVAWAHARVARSRARRGVGANSSGAVVGVGISGARNVLGAERAQEAEAHRLLLGLFCLTLTDVDQTMEGIVDKVQTFTETRPAQEPPDQLRVIRFRACSTLSVDFQNALRRFMEIPRLVFVMETRTIDYVEDAFRSRWTTIHLAPLSLTASIRLLTETARALARTHTCANITPVCSPTAQVVLPTLVPPTFCSLFPTGAASPTAASTPLADAKGTPPLPGTAPHKRGAQSYSNATVDREATERARKSGVSHASRDAATTPRNTWVVAQTVVKDGAHADAIGPRKYVDAEREEAKSGATHGVKRIAEAPDATSEYTTGFLERVATYARGDARRALQSLYNASQIGTPHVEHLLTMQTGTARAAQRILDACARGHSESAFSAARDFDAARFTLTEFVECATQHVETLAATPTRQVRAQALLQCITQLQMRLTATSTQSVTQLYGAVARLLMDSRFRAGPPNASRPISRLAITRPDSTVDLAPPT
jgi:DNA polymerase III delta prime subunit